MSSTTVPNPANGSFPGRSCRLRTGWDGFPNVKVFQVQILVTPFRVSCGPTERHWVHCIGANACIRRFSAIIAWFIISVYCWYDFICQPCPFLLSYKYASWWQMPHAGICMYSYLRLILYTPLYLYLYLHLHLFDARCISPLDTPDARCRQWHWPPRHQREWSPL